MKKRGALSRIRMGGVLHGSTLCILAGGMVGLTGCEKSYTATAKDQQVAELQKQLDALDAQKTRLTNGEVTHNFELPGVGFYHADARDFFPFRHGHSQDGKWYANGAWQDSPPGEPQVAASRPSPDALKRVELALQHEQEQLEGVQQGAQAAAGQPVVHHHGGFGNALMMYWLLSGNRGFFSPGAGFTAASGQASRWQGGLDQQRQAVSSHAAASPGYRRMVEQSRMSGRPVVAGQSVRGGFGSSGSSGRTSFGS
jgi:hypothetical protein